MSVCGEPDLERRRISFFDKALWRFCLGCQGLGFKGVNCRRGGDIGRANSGEFEAWNRAGREFDARAAKDPQISPEFSPTNARSDPPHSVVAAAIDPQGSSGDVRGDVVESVWRDVVTSTNAMSCEGDGLWGSRRAPQCDHSSSCPHAALWRATVRGLGLPMCSPSTEARRRVAGAHRPFGRRTAPSCGRGLRSSRRSPRARASSPAVRCA